MLDVGWDLDFLYKKQNISSKRMLSRELLIDELKSDLGDELYNEVIDQNRYDLALYEHATGVISERFTTLAEKDQAVAQSLHM